MVRETQGLEIKRIIELNLMKAQVYHVIRGGFRPGESTKTSPLVPFFACIFVFSLVIWIFNPSSGSRMIKTTNTGTVNNEGRLKHIRLVSKLANRNKL